VGKEEEKGAMFANPPPSHEPGEARNAKEENEKDEG
jgi:hypothetical protein